MLEAIFNKHEGLQVCNFTKTRPQNKRFSMNIEKFLRTAISKNICKRLFLNLQSKHLGKIVLKRFARFEQNSCTGVFLVE